MLDSRKMEFGMQIAFFICIYPQKVVHLQSKSKNNNTMANLQSMFDYYLQNQDEFVKMYNGKYLVLTDDGVQSAYDTKDEAYSVAVQRYGIGNFIIQLCTEGTDAYTQTFHSRVIYA